MQTLCQPFCEMIMQQHTHVQGVCNMPLIKQTIQYSLLFHHIVQFWNFFLVLICNVAIKTGFPSCSATVLQCYGSAVLCCCSAIVLQCYGAAVLWCCSTIDYGAAVLLTVVLQYYGAAVLKCCSDMVLQCHCAAVL